MNTAATPPSPSTPTDLFAGIGLPLRGFGFLISKPALWKYAALPFGINLVVMTSLLWVAVAYWDPLITWLTHAPDTWYYAMIFWVVYVLAAVLGCILFFYLATVAGTLIAAPFNDLLVRKTLTLLDGADAPDLPLTWDLVMSDAWRSIRHISLNLLLWVALNLAFLLLHFVPLVGSIAHLVLSGFSTCLFAAEVYLDLPMSVFRWGWRQKWRLLLDHKWPLAAFGACATLIPCVNYLFLPIWVVSGALAFRFYSPRSPA